MTRKDAIYITSDQRFVRYAIALLNSIAVNYPNHPEIIVHCHGSFSEQSMELLGSYKNTTIIDSDKEFEKFILNVGPTGTGRFNSKAFKLTKFSTFQLWSEKFSEYDQILYLDVDTLVLPRLDELFGTNDFFMVDAVNRTNTSIVGKSGWHSVWNIRLNFLLALDRIKLPDLSANSGVFVHPPKYRNTCHYRDLRRLLQRYSNDAWSDQSIINLWMAKNGIEPSRDYRFNFQVRFFDLVKEGFDNLATLDDETRIQLEKAKHDIRIFHFNNLKPDHSRFLAHKPTSDLIESRDLYFEYYNNGRPVSYVDI